MRIASRFPAECVFAAAAIFGLGAAGRGQMREAMTPVLLEARDAPVPFTGSDGRTHLVYELWMTNFSSADAAVKQVEVMGDGKVLESLDAAAVSRRLQLAGVREANGTLAAGRQGLLFLHVMLADGADVPLRLSHRVMVHADAAPPGQQEITESGGEVGVNRRAVALIAAPVRGDGYVSADSCCDATRHTRAALPVNGRVWIAQRYAVDWEQVDAQRRIYNGPKEKLESYAIFGKPVFAVADAMVVSATDGLPEQTPGKYPVNIPLQDADGNSVVLDLGDGQYAMYAHMKPGSIRVHEGDRVKVGQVIGQVGNSGNSVAPHLHFQVMDAPSSLAASGLPYEIRDFKITGTTPGTAAFDEAEEKGVPIPITPVTPVQRVKNALPLDQLVIFFAAPER
jgi:hypothetical protein